MNPRRHVSLFPFPVPELLHILPRSCTQSPLITSVLYSEALLFLLACTVKPFYGTIIFSLNPSKLLSKPSLQSCQISIIKPHHILMFWTFHIFFSALEILLYLQPVVKPYRI
jgi:hypothetical protein